MREQVRVVLAVARKPALARIELAYLGFQTAEYATWMAILVYGYAIGGAALAGLVALIQLIPAGIVGPLASYAGDRYRWDRVLVAGYVLVAASDLATAWALYAGLPLPATIAVATVASAALTIIRPIQAVALPAITHTPADLTAANAVTALAESVANCLGPLAAGLLLLRNQPADVFLAFAIVVGIGAVLVARLPEAHADARVLHTATETSAAGELLGGFASLTRDRGLLLIVLVLGSSTIVVGALDVLYIAVAVTLLGQSASWAGGLGAAAGVGSILGALAAVTLVGRRRLTPAVGLSGALFGLPIAAIGEVPSLLGAGLLFAVSGAGWSVNNAAGQTLLQRLAPEALRARVFGVLEGLSMFAMAIGSVAIGLVVQSFGVPVALVVAGLVVPVVLLAAWRELAAVDRHARAPDHEALELLRRLPIFAPLSAPAIDRILAEVAWLDVPAGETVIRQGEPGDRFYVIGEGEVMVTVDGQAVGTRSTGDGFGEIALLRNVPRTATVIALTPLRLLTVERERFLEAVTGHRQSRFTAEAVASAQLAVAAPTVSATAPAVSATAPAVSPAAPAVSVTAPAVKPAAPAAKPAAPAVNPAAPVDPPTAG
ncbi:MAG TPA: cyclic nucleotide-binding domain-containing protein [Candidatus Limnocylindrales bacterium]|nr:cyclic nucleotide-binding domain-containing protein [Candidatus Limnocylindrales bacterium]